MKVALVINELNIRGGTHKQFLRLCQYLENNKIDFDIYTKIFDSKKTYPEFSKYNVYSLNANYPHYTNGSFLEKVKGKVFLYKQDYRLFLLLKSKTYNIINIHDNGLPNFIHWCQKIKNCKVVWQINDLPGCFKVGVSYNQNKKIIDDVKCWLYRKLAQKINLITVNVSKNKDRVLSCLNKEALVLYCGVDKNPDLSSHYFKLKEEIKILSSGVFFPYRNYETQIVVVNRLKEDGYSVHLDIIGSTESDKDYSTKINDLIEQNKLENEIKIWGQVDEKVYADLHNNADIFCFINVNQSWGLAVFEAMSCGLPVIVSNSVGAIEILNDGEDSIFVDPFDVETICHKIICLNSNNEYYDKISMNASNAVSKMSWDEMYCSKLIECFNKLLE